MKRVFRLDRSSIVCAALSALFLAGSGHATATEAQQSPLDHEDVLTWNQIGDPSLSPDGNWVAFSVSPLEGDPSIRVRSAAPGGSPLSRRGTDPVFTSDSRFVVFRVAPFESVVDSLKLAGKKSSDLPKDSLGVADLAEVFVGRAPQNAGVRAFGPIESFAVPDEGSWVAYLLAETDDEAGDPATPDGGGSEEVPDTKKKEDGKTLVLHNLIDGSSTRIDNVEEYVFSEDGSTLAYTTSTVDGSDDGAHAVTLASGATAALHEGEGHYKQIAVSKDGRQVAFLTNEADWASDTPEYALYMSVDRAASSMVAASDNLALPSDWIVSANGDVRFSDGGGFLHFGTAPRPVPEPEATAPDDEQVSVDVWNWKDPYLQPMQLVQLEEERKRTYAAVVHLDGATAGRVAQLGMPDVPTVRFVAEGDAEYALGLTDVPYRQLISWDGRYQDIWSINVRSGERIMVAQAVKGFGGAQISPAGRYASWWDGGERQWKAAPLAHTDSDQTRVIVLSQSSEHAVWNELDDHPDEPPPYGSAGWTEEDAGFIYYDRHDAFRFDPASGSTTALTSGMGRDLGLRFRYAATDPELDFVPNGPVLWQSFDLEDKRSGFFEGRSDRAVNPQQIVMANKRFSIRAKADDADRWLVTREDFSEFPDLHVTDASFTDLVRVSEANPQQGKFSWGSAELVSWMSNDGVRLQGLLFKPQDFDPMRKYPTMVYFYERMSDGLYQYRAPTPGSSSISVPFYVSRGYVVFIPDIPYEIGYPGESALDAVVPGVLSLIDKGFIDRDRIGVQGHSWGGYQIAYMITKTNLFTAAEAGAPVSNMTSAYGGIRWQTGMSRMFQYERTQSRIGGTLWESTQEYLHNSPLFFADKIQTPLLMMHNDEDGAVPWYQGIEMFVSMRRLQKPVWMLNYNGEAHGLRQDHNRKDWAIRMQQFFDHYLMDAPPPIWMEEGVPALLKGRSLGTGLVAPKAGVSQDAEGGGIP